MALMCKELGCLPRAGGLKDQDSRDVFLLNVVNQAIQEKMERDRKP